MRLAIALVLLTAGCATSDPPLSADGSAQAMSKPEHSRAKAGNRNPRAATPFTARRSLRVLHGRADRDNQRAPLHDWTGVARCESGGNPRTDTGNGYYGLLQESLTFWRSFGGLSFAARPDLATAAEQITVAERGLAVQGAGAWPVCGKYLEAPPRTGG